MSRISKFLQETRDLGIFPSIELSLKSNASSAQPSLIISVVQIKGGTFPESLFLEALKVRVSPRYGPSNAVETEIEVFHRKREKRIRSEARKVIVRYVQDDKLQAFPCFPCPLRYSSLDLVIGKIKTSDLRKVSQDIWEGCHAARC
ncbi:hypothetical protein EE612_058453 [Oryza sativa]|nr:hypothetical protein EE612_058453 [Oryza sativa]KAB8116969.1 hypothetical protein EE612_058453 [Oryza sativa]